MPLNTTNVASLSHDGRGIAHLNNKIVFLDNALPKEQVKFVYTKHHNKFSEGKVIEILQGSPDRVTPLCQHYHICGGCSLQHLNHQQQISFKAKVFQEQLNHIGGLVSKSIFQPIIGPAFGYRSKARLSVKYVQKKQKVLVGFHEKNGRHVTATVECPILHQAISNKIALLSQLIANLSVYQHIPQIEVACGTNVTALVLRHLQKFSVTDIKCIKEFGDAHQIQFYSQSGGIETVKPIDVDQTIIPLSYKLPDHNIEITFAPTDFTQINHTINTQMVNLVLELLEIQPNDKILDLFCGIGNFTLPLAKKCEWVTGIEGNKNAVERAKQNAENNKLKNLEFHVADLTKELSGTAWNQKQYAKILLDPPRTGAKELCNEIKKFNAKKIVYVSCNPATLARDAKIIAGHGYELQNATLVDMYPHTSHMEVVASFTK